MLFQNWNYILNQNKILFTGENMIKAENTSKTYESPRGRHCVLNGFACEIPDNFFFGIAGKSGAGKSTLLSIFAGVLEPDEGKIFVNGNDIFSMTDKERALFRNKNIGYVSQEQSFLKNLTVFDNVRLPYFLGHGADSEKINARAEKLLKNLDIAHLRNCYPSELSGGENHRVLIARALINNPDFIFADEPTSSLDREQASEVLKIFQKLKESGKTVVMVSHDEYALEVCDKVLTL